MSVSRTSPGHSSPDRASTMESDVMANHTDMDNNNDLGTFREWKFHIASALADLGICGILTGEWSAPKKKHFDESADYQRSLARWTKADADAKAILLDHCSDEMLNDSEQFRSSHQLWDFLENRHGAASRNLDRILDVQDLCKLEYDGGSIQQFERSFNAHTCALRMSRILLPEDFMIGILLGRMEPFFGTTVAGFRLSIALANSVGDMPKVESILQAFVQEARIQDSLAQAEAEVASNTSSNSTDESEEEEEIDNSTESEDQSQSSSPPANKLIEKEQTNTIILPSSSTNEQRVACHSSKSMTFTNRTHARDRGRVTEIRPASTQCVGHLTARKVVDSGKSTDVHPISRSTAVNQNIPVSGGNLSAPIAPSASSPLRAGKARPAETSSLQRYNRSHVEPISQAGYRSGAQLPLPPRPSSVGAKERIARDESIRRLFNTTWVDSNRPITVARPVTASRPQDATRSPHFSVPTRQRDTHNSSVWPAPARITPASTQGSSSSLSLYRPTPAERLFNLQKTNVQDRTVGRSQPISSSSSQTRTRSISTTMIPTGPCALNLSMQTTGIPTGPRSFNFSMANPQPNGQLWTNPSISRNLSLPGVRFDMHRHDLSEPSHPYYRNVIWINPNVDHDPVNILPGLDLASNNPGLKNTGGNHMNPSRVEPQDNEQRNDQGRIEEVYIKDSDSQTS